MPKIANPQFGRWVREKRAVLGLSQQEVADIAGMSRQQLNRLENGDSGTRRDSVQRLAEALKADMNEAYQMAGFSPDKVDAQHELNYILHGLTEDQTRIVLTIAKAARDSLLHTNAAA